MSHRRLSDWQKQERLITYPYGDKARFADLALCVGPGWTDLLDELCAKLFALGWSGEIEQVKEKFGTLRFYFVNTCGDFADIAFDVVDATEARSAFVCELCGEHGEVKSLHGWLVCRCDTCFEKEDTK